MPTWIYSIRRPPMTKPSRAGRSEGMSRHQRTERLAGDVRGEGIEAMSEFLECLADLMEKYKVDKVDVELIAQHGRKE